MATWECYFKKLYHSCLPSTNQALKRVEEGEKAESAIKQSNKSDASGDLGVLFFYLYHRCLHNIVKKTKNGKCYTKVLQVIYQDLNKMYELK